jgi:hypothetical protein
MTTDPKYYEPTNEEIIAHLIDQLLDKTEDRKLDVELFGYPANVLDSPQSKKTVVESNRPDELIEVEIMRTTNGEVILGTAFRSYAPMLLLDFGMKKAWIKTKRLRSLIHSHKGQGEIIPVFGGEKFIVRLSKGLLLDNCSF